MILFWCGVILEKQQIFVFQGYKMSALNPNQYLPSALRSQREQIVTNKPNFHIFSSLRFTAAFCYARLLSWCSFLNAKSTEEVPGSAAHSLSQGITHAEVMRASPHPEAWKHTGASPVKLIINCVTCKWNKPEVQAQEFVLWCFCMGKWVAMEEGRETRKWFWGAAHWLIPYQLHGWNTGNRNKSDMTSLGRINSGEKNQATPPNLIYFPAPQTHHHGLFTYHHFLFTFYCSSLQNTSKSIFIKVLSSCEQAVLYLENEGKITVLSPPTVKSQVINPDYFIPGLCLCFNNSMAHLLPLCWEHQ